MRRLHLPLKRQLPCPSPPHQHQHPCLNFPPNHCASRSLSEGRLPSLTRTSQVGDSMMTIIWISTHLHSLLAGFGALPRGSTFASSQEQTNAMGTLQLPFNSIILCAHRLFYYISPTLMAAGRRDTDLYVTSVLPPQTKRISRR